MDIVFSRFCFNPNDLTQLIHMFRAIHLIQLKNHEIKQTPAMTEGV